MGFYKVKLAFKNWSRQGENLEGTEEDIELTKGDFHSGTVFEAFLDIKGEALLKKAIESKAYPVFELFKVENKITTEQDQSLQDALKYYSENTDKEPEDYLHILKNAIDGNMPVLCADDPKCLRIGFVIVTDLENDKTEHYTLRLSDLKSASLDVKETIMYYRDKQGIGFYTRDASKKDGILK